MQYGPYLEHETETIHCGSDALVVSRVGALACDWQVVDAGQELHLFDGYADDRELRVRDGAREAVMVPFSNRIQNAKYVFDGVEYDFGPDANGVREKMHGLVLDNIFEVVDKTESSLILQTTVSPRPAYPWELSVRVRYELFSDPHRVELTIEVENLSEKVAPVAVGWHPYLNYVGGDWREARVEIPGTVRVNLEEDLTPLPGNEAFTEVDCPVVFEAPQGLDVAFTGLKPDADGVIRGRLIHPSGAVTTVEFMGEVGGPGVGVLHVFTGETLPDRPQYSFAFEPCEFMTNQFNRRECETEIRLEPGATHCYRAAVSFAS